MRIIILSAVAGVFSFFSRLEAHLSFWLRGDIYFGRHLSRVPAGSIVLFPCRPGTLNCGLAGIVAFKQPEKADGAAALAALDDLLNAIEADACFDTLPTHLSGGFCTLGGDHKIGALRRQAQRLKGTDLFVEIYQHPDFQDKIRSIADRLEATVQAADQSLATHTGRLHPAETEAAAGRIDQLKDIAWCLSTEVLNNIKKIQDLTDQAGTAISPGSLALFKQINAVLNSIDRLEVRGRDSAGISLIVNLDPDVFRRFQKSLEALDLVAPFSRRSSQNVLVNGGISVRLPNETSSDGKVSFAMTYKVAAEIGNLGDNIRFLRDQIRQDAIFQTLATLPFAAHTILSHTRWASVGAITEANCHPVDNKTTRSGGNGEGLIHVCLNGDIDNYRQLRAVYDVCGDLISGDITTDTKIIPLQISRHYHDGHPIEEAFRLAVNDFKGSHAISMHTDLAPGKLFLAQKGSGQAVFIGLSEDYFMPTSEVYGFIEETSRYLKMDGEQVVAGRNGETQGQIFVLDQHTGGGLAGIQAMFYDGTPIDLSERDIRHTDITTRDIDRQGFPHYFLKEISEAPLSVERTLRGRWKAAGSGSGLKICLDEATMPARITDALKSKKIRRVYFVGQGTAGVAALACSNILEYYTNDPTFWTGALKASELSGFTLKEHDRHDAMADTLVIAISQSGTTTDTNRTIDMVRERGAYTIAIVNRRDSDITFKVDGVMYTSSGRDIEMSVASTKAFYSQIVAGALLSLYIARLKSLRDDHFVSAEIRKMRELPMHMQGVLKLKKKIEMSAFRHAAAKTYWASVGSGPNKAAADEIRIKLSELCYKTISSDYIEDKKHIDLSSEPLILVCAAGTKGHVIGDIVKDTAIFQAHKATPIVIADEGETRFDPYSADVFHVPAVDPHFAPILNTLAGHLWGYFAAMAINDGSLFLYNFREDIQKTICDCSERGLDVYEVVLEKSFREKMALFYNAFRRKNGRDRFPSAMGIETASDLTLLLKYLSGRLPVSDFEIDFGKKGTALNMINTLFECVGNAINAMARPIDAIKHQAKTVTVGTSRIRETVEGILFDRLAADHFNASHLTNSNVIVLKKLQAIVSQIHGAILYRIDGLNLLGELTEQAGIHLEKKEGTLAPLPSRTETDATLKGTKRIIVRQGNVYIGRGRKDERSIIIIPIISDSPQTPNLIEHLLLLHIGFKTDVPLTDRIQALGGKYEHIVSIVQENSIAWSDELLERVEMETLFGVSAEKIGEEIVSSLNGTAAQT